MKENTVIILVYAWDNVLYPKHCNPNKVHKMKIKNKFLAI